MKAPSLETIFTDARFFGVTTATPVQRAICRISEGLPLGELASCADVEKAVGGPDALAVLAPGSFRPRELDLLAGIRSGKSRFVAAHAFWSSQTIDISRLQAGEVPRYPILSINLTSARATFNHLAGTMMDRPLMRGLLVGEPEAETLFIKSPSGRPVEVTSVAGARAGANLVSVWLAGAAFEEHARQVGSSEGFIVNFDDQLNSATGRTVEGGQILCAGSPWAAHGPAYERHAAYFGRPSPDRVVIVATGPMMNPTWWTESRCETLKRSNPTAHTTDVLAQFADPTSSFLTQSEIKSAVREAPLVLPPRTGRGYLAAMDPATRGNAWTLIVGAYYQDVDGVTRYEVVLARQWIGSSLSPQSPHRVLGEIAKLVKPYNIHQVFTDQHAGDHNREIGARFGLDIIIRTVTPGNSPEASSGKRPPPGRAYRNDLYETVKGAFASGVISIPNEPVLLGDLRAVRRRLTSNSLTYDLPETTDGRHCDYAPALALVLAEFPSASDARALGRDREHAERLHAAASRWFNGATEPTEAERQTANAQLAIQLAAARRERIESGADDRDREAWDDYLKNGDREVVRQTPRTPLIA